MSRELDTPNSRRDVYKRQPQCLENDPLPENKAQHAELLKAIDNCTVEDLPAMPRNAEADVYKRQVLSFANFRHTSKR